MACAINYIIVRISSFITKNIQIMVDGSEFTWSKVTEIRELFGVTQKKITVWFLINREAIVNYQDASTL